MSQTEKCLDGFFFEKDCCNSKINYFCSPFNGKGAGVVKLVDTLDLGSSAARCVGSSPIARTSSIEIKPW